MEVVSARSPRSVKVSAKLPPAAEPSALARSAPPSVTLSSAVMLSVPALLDWVTLVYGTVEPGTAGRSTTWRAPLTSMIEPASSAMVAFCALMLTLPASSSVPVTRPLSLGLCTKLPRADRKPAEPSSNFGAIVWLSSALTLTLMVPAGA